MQRSVRLFVASALKVFIPCLYGGWFIRLASDNFDGKQLLIFVPAYLLSLIGIWRVTVFLAGLFEPAEDRPAPAAKK